MRTFRTLPSLLLLALSLALGGCAYISTLGQSAIIQSPADAKHYRALELDNGLKALLVSDPNADRAAASLDVQVGSGNEPAGWQGLAHFLEHMLFLGNRKYPEAGEYRNFISEHGGSNNAYTTFDSTNYYFDISADHLLPALERFSRFFIDPIFTPAFVDRERAVVHSEYQSRLKDDGRRMWDARRQLISREHPASQFSVGSAHTLRDRDGVSVRDKLIEFYERHYSADIMTLAVVGREDLDQLEEWVRGLFAEVPDRDAEVVAPDAPYFNPQMLGARLDVKSLKDAMWASFMFPVPSAEADYRSKPLSYIANLIGHEGEGSLLARLDSLGWAEGLSAGGGYMDEAQGVFEVSIQLTEQGLARLDDIGALLFQYIARIESDADGVSRWRYDQARRLANMEFRFAEERTAGSVARHLAPALQRYPVADVLRGPYMMEDYRPGLIRDFLARLGADNVLLQVMSRDAPTGGSGSGKTPFYGVDYAIRPIEPAVLARWAAARNSFDADSGADTRLALPAPNPFIPERLTAHRLDPAQRTPQRLATRDGMQAWHHADPEFGTPRASFYFSVKSPAAIAATATAREMVLTELFVRLVNKRLDQPGYPARLAGLDYQLYRHGRGFSVRISGYADKQPALLEAVLAGLFVPDFDADKLALAKAELRREWQNAALEPPSRQAAHELYRLLMHPYWSEAERLAVLARVDIRQLTAHAARLLSTVNITSLAHGDITKARAAQMNTMLASAFAGARWVGEPARQVVRMLDAGAAYLRSMDVDHGDSALLAYFQGADKSDAERAKMALLGRLLETSFFYNLRTINRVGYLVYATPMPILDVPGLLFSVQSPSHGPAQIHRLVEDFLGQFAGDLDAMPDADFARVKRGLAERILTRDKTFTERTDRYWREIDRREYGFDTRRRLAGLIEDLDKADIRRYFQRITAERPRQLLVQSPGRRTGAAELELAGAQYTPVTGAVEFRRRLPAFFPAY